MISSVPCGVFGQRYSNLKTLQISQMCTCSTMMGSSLLKLMTWLSNRSRRSRAAIYIHTTLPSHHPHELYATLVRKSATADEVDAAYKFRQHGGRNLWDPITSLPPTELHKQITSYIVTRKGKHGVSKFHGYIGKFPFSFTWKLSMSFFTRLFSPKKSSFRKPQCKRVGPEFLCGYS